MKKFIYFLVVGVLIGCSTTNTKIQKSADNTIYMSTLKAPKECTYINEIHGKRKLETFSTNPKFVTKDISEVHMRHAQKLGGNYIERYEHLNIGKVYKCPISALEQLEKSDE